jgi:hypothetical protein
MVIGHPKKVEVIPLITERTKDRFMIRPMNQRTDKRVMILPVNEQTDN